MSCNTQSLRRLAVALALACAACKPAPQKPAKAPAAVPMVRATVVTIRTTIEPGKQTTMDTLVIQGDRARSTAEHDRWRFFDAKAKTVTFVDDIDRTFRTEPLAALVKRRHLATAGKLPAHYPTARFLRNDTRRTLLGLPSQQSVIESGLYRRELWLAEHPSIPRGLFALMHAAETPSTPLVPMMRAVDDALAAVEGYPLLDRTEVPYGNKKMIIDRAVINVAQRDVPASTLTIPNGYRDLTAKAK